MPIYDIPRKDNDEIDAWPAFDGANAIANRQIPVLLG